MVDHEFQVTFFVLLQLGFGCDLFLTLLLVILFFVTLLNLKGLLQTADNLRIQIHSFFRLLFGCAHQGMGCLKDHRLLGGISDLLHGRVFTDLATFLDKI